MKIKSRKYLLLVVLIVVCTIGYMVISRYAKKKESEQQVPVGFRSEVMLHYSPVKDQGKSELCWIYAMLATIETEHITQGDSVNLSTDFLARCYLREKAEKYYDSDCDEDISMRGMAPMTITLLRRYGCMPHDSYYSVNPINYNVLVRKVEQQAQVAMNKHESKDDFIHHIDELLDREIGYLPGAVYMLGAEYTPLEFAHSVCGKKEYVSLTSLDSEEYNKELLLPFRDNYYNCKALNINPDSLVQRMDKSLHEGHPVMWEGGPDDNHAVAVIGMGKDKSGVEYYVAKNSWGKDNPTKGLLYIEKQYVREHTAVVVMQQEL